MSMSDHDFYNAPLAAGGFTHAARLLSALQNAARVLGITDEPESSRRGALAEQVRDVIVAATGGEFAVDVRNRIAELDKGDHHG